MARPGTLPGEAGNQIAANNFAEATYPAPVPPEAPQVTVPDGAPPVLTLEDILPTIPLPAQENEVFDDEEFAGPDFLGDIF